MEPRRTKLNYPKIIEDILARTPYCDQGVLGEKGSNECFGVFMSRKVEKVGALVEKCPKELGRTHLKWLDGVR